MGKPYWNDRREKFAQALASGLPSEEAGALVGYSAANSRRNARRRDVVARVGELKAPAMAKIAERLVVTLESLLEEAEEVRRLAVSDSQYAAAIAAIKEKGVLSGKRIERSEHGEPGEFERMSDDELKAAITEQARLLGFEPTQH